MPRMEKMDLSLTASWAVLFCLATIAAVGALDAETALAAAQNDAAAPADADQQSTPSQAKPTARQRIDELIERLGDEDYQVRNDAQEQLARLGFEAFDALSAAEYNADPEIAGRARYLLRLLQVDFTDKNDSQQVQAILREYLSRSTDEKIEIMRALAALPKGDGLAALCRLVRFQRSALLSKHAAAAILRWQTDNRDAIAQTAPLIERMLAASEQPGAIWLRESLKFTAEPQAALSRWAEFIRGETELLGRGDGRTDARLAWMLIRHELCWTFALERSNEEKSASWQRMASLLRKDKDAINLLIPGLVEEEAWKALGQEPVEFAERFVGNPRGTFYALAEALEKQGKSPQAEAAAERAFQLAPGSGARQESERLETAALLQKQGRFKWAEREYRHCLENGDGDVELVLVAGSYLSEMLHDQGAELPAAEALGQLLDKLKDEKLGGGKRPGRIDVLGVELKSMEARRYFLLAEHHRASGDVKKQRELLEKALAADPSEVDVLIACYRLPDSPPEFRDKVKKHIRETVDRTRLLILKNTGLPTYYNQLAWLVANTEGDFDEALRFSQESLRLQPNVGGYYDTLARCYFAKGELEKAVEAQTRAAELEPHNGLIARQLEQFKKSPAEKGK